jgi:hypothetical protein
MPLAVYLRLRYKTAELDRRLRDLETNEGLRDMLKMHIGYLDYLTAEARGSVNHRTEFTSFYLSRHRKKK